MVTSITSGGSGPVNQKSSAAKTTLSGYTVPGRGGLGIHPPKTTPPKGSPPDPKVTQIKPPVTPDKDFSFNLPPHTWSLPTKPAMIGDANKYLNPDVLNFDKFKSVDAGQKSELSPRSTIIDDKVTEENRRGRMWFWLADKSTHTTQDGADPSKQTSRKFGFQFLWNPTEYGVAVSLNTDITPTPSDRFVSVAGVFPSGENLSVTVRLDRTNDFACARQYVKSGNLSGLSTYYNSAEYGGNFDIKIKELLTLGTVSDIEYLYKAVNGPGWKNIMGRETSDIGYLSATLLGINLGPLAFVGYIQSLAVSHVGFSQDMTPIRTDVTINVNLMASAGLASTGTAAPIAPKKTG